MLHFTWKVFAQTGNIDTYLLYKELSQEMEEAPDEDENFSDVDLPVT